MGALKSENHGITVSGVESDFLGLQDEVQNEKKASRCYENRCLAPEDEARISHWATTSRDVSALMVPYLIGLCIALAHLLLFSHLNQKRIGIDTKFPQSWVSVTSLVLVTVFRLCLCLALGNAFTQHLWRIVRLNSVKVVDLDRYYSMQKDPLALLHLRVLLRAPSLYAMAFLGFSIGAAIIFPPGALTIESKRYQSVQTQSVGVFNASFMGNGSLKNALDQSLLQRGRLFMPPYFTPKSIVSSTAKMALIAGEMPVLTSPCGPDCTYTVMFDGPQVKCSSYTRNSTATIPITRILGYSDYNDTAAIPPTVMVGYSASLPDWSLDWTPVDRKSWGDVYVDCPEGEVGAFCMVTSYYEDLLFEWYSFDTSNTNITLDHDVATYPRSAQGLKCIPGYAKYTAEITFSNGVPVIKIDSTYIGSLVDFWRSSGRSINKEGTATRYFDPEGLVKAANLFAVLTSFAEPLKGQIIGARSLSITRNNTFTFKDSSIDDDHMGGSVTLGSNETIILDTAFNRKRFELYNQSNWKINVLDITENKINQALQNITMALLKLNSDWNTTTNVTQSNYQNIFFFSPVQLIVPYACCLAAILPFLLLGYSSLRLNGVPAMSGGFVQTLMTTTGSEALRDAAAAGCLGGQRNIPQQLEDMEIMYGELHDARNREGDIRRATFGVKGEIVELKKGALYGR